MKGVALVTTFDGQPLLVKVARVPRGQLKVFWSLRRRPDSISKTGDEAVHARRSLRIDWKSICSGIAVPLALQALVVVY